MVANDGFFQRPQAAAVLKHGILQRYSHVFATMAGSQTGRVVYFDGYAGQGRYDDGAPGSPLLAVESAKKVASSGRRLECLFAEQEAAAASNLREVLEQEAPEGVTYVVRQGDVASHVDEALAMAGTDPLLTFLDPFGTPLARDLLTQKLLGRPASQATEVLLNLNLEAVGRVGGLLRASKPKASDELALRRLDSAFGAWWRDSFRSVHRPGVAGTGAAAAQAVAIEFMKQVNKQCGFGCVSVPVRRRPTHEPLFFLILFTRYPYAPWKFNDQVSLASREWRRACAEADLEATINDLGQQEDLFGDSTSTWLRESAEEAWDREEKAREEEWSALIASNLRAVLSTESVIPLGRRMSAVYGQTLGLAREKHVNRAWDQLAAEGFAEPRLKGQRTEKLSIVRAKPTP